MGFRLANYELQEAIGQGGMGIVYRATDVNLGRTVAVKVLRDDLRSQSHLVARFRREAEAFASLDHPNIVHIYAVGAVGKVPYIAMEYVDGQPLSKILEERAPLSWEETLDIGIQVVDALACAHQGQIIHRDIKPGNILIDKNGHAYVTDFGIAKVMTAATQLTVDGSRLGTPQYMCPERCQNKSITPASDLYSLGVVMFQCMAASLPFKTSTTAELIAKIAGEQPPRLSTFVSDIPSEVDRLIAFMLERNPKDRAKNAGMLCDSMKRVREGKPLDEQAEEQARIFADYIKDMKTPRPNAAALTKSKLKGIIEAWLSLSPAKRITYSLLLITVFSLGMGWPLQQALHNKTQFRNTFLGENSIQSWFEVAPLITHTRETDSVSLIHLSLPHNQVKRINWSVSSASLLIELGVDKSDPLLPPANGILAVQPETRKITTLILPMAQFATCQQTTQLPVWGMPGDPQAYLIALDSGTRSFSTIHDVLPDVFWPRPLLAAFPFNENKLLILDQPDKQQWAIHTIPVPHFNQQNTLLTSEYPITSMACHKPSMVWAYVTRHAGNRHRLHVRRPGITLDAIVIDANAEIRFGNNAFSPDATRLMYLQAESSGSYTIHMLNLENKQTEFTTGPVLNATIHPSKNYIVAIAPDPIGRAQLWQIFMGDTVQKKQLTHLDSGITRELALHPNGHEAWSTSPAENTLVQVQLSDTLPQ